MRKTRPGGTKLLALVSTGLCWEALQDTLSGIRVGRDGQVGLWVPN